MNKPIEKLIFRNGGSILFIGISVIITFVAVYIVQEPVLKQKQATPEANLTLIPQNIAQSTDGTWQFPEGQEVTINVVLESGNHQIEAVETQILYDPNILTLINVTDNMTCNNLTRLNKKIGESIDGITFLPDGSIQGAENGSATVACSAADSGNTKSYTPLSERFTGTVAQFTFRVHGTATDSSIDIRFIPQSRNNSSALEYEGKCCSTTNVLQNVHNIVFDAVKQQGFASLDLSPTTGSVTTGKPFDVSVNLSTGGKFVDSVDAVIKYDATLLEAVKVKESSLFASYVKTPRETGIEVNGNQGIIDMSGVISPQNSTGVQGDNLHFATITFKPIASSGIAEISFDVEAIGERNDSNIVEFKTANDLLQFTTPTFFSITDDEIIPPPPTDKPNMYLYPLSGVYHVNKAFDVGVYITTADKEIDSADAVVQYDPKVFTANDIRFESIFANYHVVPDKANLSNANGTISITGVIDPDNPPVSGNNILMATITFIPIQESASTTISLEFEGKGARNDSNLAEYKKGVDILDSVTNATYSVVGSKVTLVENVSLQIALQGRPENQPKDRNTSIKIHNTYFEQNPINERSSILGVINLNQSHLQNRLDLGSYDFLIKPEGYLQRRVNLSLLQATTVADISDSLFLAGDFDSSGKVNVLDWGLFITQFNSDSELTDVDGSGKVTVLDGVFLITNWNKTDEH